MPGFLLRAFLLLALSAAVIACDDSPTQPTDPPPTNPAAPQNLALAITGPAQSLAFSARLTWNPPTTGPAPTGYRVQLATSPDFATFTTTQVSVTSASFDFPVPIMRTWSWRVRALDGTTEGPPSNVVTFVFAIPPPQSALPAPIPQLPADRAVFALFPRVTTLQWSTVAAAASYGFEIDFCPTNNAFCADESRTEIFLTSAHPTGQPPLTSTTLTIIFVGAQPGRWTVWAIDHEGRMGARSPFQSFVHQQ